MAYKNWFWMDGIDPLLKHGTSYQFVTIWKIVDDGLH